MDECNHRKGQKGQQDGTEGKYRKGQEEGLDTKDKERMMKSQRKTKESDLTQRRTKGGNKRVMDGSCKETLGRRERRREEERE